MASFTGMMSAENWLTVMGESSLRAAVLLGAAWAACYALRRRSAAARHLVWALSLAALLAAPFSLDLAPKVRVPAWWLGAAQPVSAAGQAIDQRDERFETQAVADVSSYAALPVTRAPPVHRKAPAARTIRISRAAPVSGNRCCLPTCLRR